jgi:UDPglucose--hexose-1-phosphate uridylyltransferase
MILDIAMENASEGEGTWQTRVVPNKFPALRRDGDTRRFHEGIYLAMGGFGQHEVIIESPLHNQQIASMDPEDVRLVIETYHRRYLQVMAHHRNMIPVIFRNHGPGAGTSLLHPHSQLIVTGVVPGHVRRRDNQAQQYFDEWGRCVFCDIMDFERKKGDRIVVENNAFLAFVPFAARVPFETWIMPRAHQADFGDISEEEKESFSEILRRILSLLYKKLNDPDYNYVIHTSPRFSAGEPHLHWYLQIRPRLTTQAGFEIGSGISINPSLPEQDAAYLKV